MMEDSELEEKFETFFKKKIVEFEEGIGCKQKKFTLRWKDHIGPNGEEIINETDVDWWIEDLLQSQYIILGGDNDKNASITFPALNLRASFQNFGFNEDIDKFRKIQKEKMTQQHKAKREHNQDVA